MVRDIPFLEASKRNILKFLNKKSAIILGYHGIYSKGPGFPIFTKMNSHLFEEQISFLAKNYNCISLAELKQQLQKGKISPYSIVITFDDGFANNYSEAFPILKKYNVSATIFVTAGLLDTPIFIWNDQVSAILSATMKTEVQFGSEKMKIRTPFEKKRARFFIVTSLKQRSPLHIKKEIANLQEKLQVSNEFLFNDALMQHCFGILTKEQVKEMHESGLIEIGSHGMTHSIISKLSDKEALWEIEQSKKLLEEIIAHSVTSYAYPNGTLKDFTKFHRKTLAKVGFNCVLTTIVERITVGVDFMQLPRYCVSGEMSISGFKYLLTH